ncbi:MAG: hypothetical protein M1814_006626 [Vezdaea aestivalis]|nr:MAG: hypothetical protein M1814_006626 [Vezdaea aestivalis]
MEVRRTISRRRPAPTLTEEQERRRSRYRLRGYLISRSNTVFTWSALEAPYTVPANTVIPSSMRYEYFSTGSQSMLYQQKGTKKLLKLPRGGLRSFHYEFKVQEAIYKAIHEVRYLVPTDVKVPQALFYLKAPPERTGGSHRWAHKSLSERQYRIFWSNVQLHPHAEAESDVFCTEHIPALPRCILENLIPYFHPSLTLSPTEKRTLLSKPLHLHIHLNNSPCPSSATNPPPHPYPLRLHQMQTLDLDTHSWTESMASALAILHWRCNLDGLGVKFLLGGTPNDPPSGRPQWKPGMRGDRTMRAQLWMNGFGRCMTFSKDVAGLDEAVVAFKKNAFFPSPLLGEGRGGLLWRAFRTRYLVTSKQLLESEEGQESLAEAFVRMVEGGEGPAEERFDDADTVVNF